MVLDLDRGDAGEFAASLTANERAHVRVASGRPGGAHFYLRSDGSWPTGNWDWSNGDFGGEVRYDAGYVIVWSPDALFEVSELEACADVELAGMLGYRGETASMFKDTKPAKKKRGRKKKDYEYPPGERDEKLFTDLGAAVAKSDQDANRTNPRSME